MNLKFSGFSPENKNIVIYSYLLGLRSRFSSKGQHGWSSQLSEVKREGEMSVREQSGLHTAQWKVMVSEVRAGRLCTQSWPFPLGWKVIDTSIPFVTQPPEHSSFTH